MVITIAAGNSLFLPHGETGDGVSGYHSFGVESADRFHFIELLARWIRYRCGNRAGASLRLSRSARAETVEILSRQPHRDPDTGFLPLHEIEFSAPVSGKRNQPYSAWYAFSTIDHFGSTKYDTVRVSGYFK